MSQRESGYKRKERDLYETPEWVTVALLPQLDKWRNTHAWEPACGSGQMAKVLRQHFETVWQWDIEPDHNSDALRTDFLDFEEAPDGYDAIITNPPYELATEFCERALALTEPGGGMVAMLLRTDFDHAKSRSHLFRDCPAFSKKMVLTKRIVWFAEPNGKPKAQPSFNHAWFLWDWRHEGPPTIGYGP